MAARSMESINMSNINIMSEKTKADVAYNNVILNSELGDNNSSTGEKIKIKISNVDNETFRHLNL